MLYTTARLTIPFNPALKIYGNPDQDYASYQAQVQQTARELRDQEIDKVAQKYQALVDKAEERRTKKERELRAEKKELKDRKREELFTTGEAALSLFKGRTTYTLSRVGQASRMRRQTDEDLRESREVLSEIDREVDELEQRFEAELKAVNEKWAQVAAGSQEYLITPYKKDIHVELFGVGWLPYYYTVSAGQPLLLNGFV
jgi:paraquat-inducible protein B